VIAVIDYGIGNLGSAYKALKALRVDAELVDHPRSVSEISGLILPGVGSFGACISALRFTGLDRMVYQAQQSSIPVLGICVGMQMLYQRSEESPGASGLGLLNGEVRRLRNAKKLPHMSWDTITTIKSSSLLKGFTGGEWFYFVHSFAPEVTDQTVASCDFGSVFTAVAGDGLVFGTQFHPEKSSSNGLMLLSNFVALCSEVSS
jgi:glutamine amidotransferase